MNKKQIKEIVKKELKSVLLEIEEEEPAKPQPKQKADVARVEKKLGAVASLDTLLSQINNRVELEQLLGNFVKKASQKMRPAEVVLAVRNVYAAIKEQG